MAKKTAAPSGFKITRNGSKFTLTWKINAKNSSDGQKRRHYINGKKQKTVAIGKKATKTSVTVSKATVKSVKIQIQDNQDKNKKTGAKDLAPSKWKGATFKIEKPPKSTASMVLSSTYRNVCTVSWGHDGNNFSSSDHYWYQRTERQTIFHDEKTTDNWPKKWDVVGESGSFDQREDGLTISKNIAYVRKFRFRIVGKAGINDGVTVAHYYSIPYTPSVKSAIISKNSSGGLNCAVQWYAASDTFHPIDDVVLQYGIAVPSVDMSCPYDISWTDRPSIKDTPGENVYDGDSFSIDSVIGLDRCLFVRVVCNHDFNSAYSKPFLATGITTDLSAPQTLELEDTSFEEYRTIVKITHSCDVPDACAAIVFRSEKDSVITEEIIAVFPPGVLSQTVQCPNWDDLDEFSIGSYLFVGTYGSYVETEDINVDPKKKYYTRSGNGGSVATLVEDPEGNPKEQGYYEEFEGRYDLTRDTVVVDGKDYYTLTDPDPYTYTYIANPTGNPQAKGYYELDAYNHDEVSFESRGTIYTYDVYQVADIKMRSKTLWQGGDIPRPPSNVRATSTREGVATVTWGWAWKEADIAELSWSNHDDAWESTDQPETYRISNTHAGKWNIYGLDLGMTWYIRVRLIKKTNELESVGPWSPIEPIDMSAAPNIPVLNLSKNVVSHGDTFTASWEYKSKDGTDQKDALLKLATISESGEIIYGKDLRTGIGTSRSVDFVPDHMNPPWVTGEKYGIVLRVISDSGKESDWSKPEFITVAEPIECSITSTSLETRYEYSKTTDSAPIDAEYYTVEGTPVENPESYKLRNYYELEDGVYFSTNDGVVDASKTYYTLIGQPVVNPVYIYTKVAVDAVFDINVTYYVYNGGEYIEDPDVTEENFEEKKDSLYTRTEDMSTYYERIQINDLTKLPLELSGNITGGLETGRYSSISVERTEAYFVDRPDETTHTGYENETIYTMDVNDISNIKIPMNQDEMVGTFDDTAKYTLTLYSYDDLGQSDTDTITFEVHWDHQAAIPGATVKFIPEYSVMKITPSIDPKKFKPGDTFDIYRLSVDKPELIVKGGTFGQTYIDPYPTIGEYGGHRVVTITGNGDYIANEETSDMAWIDLGEEEGDIFETDFPIINFGEGQFEILYNADLSNNWTKDFKETRYLGGHIQGDWNAGISKTSTINSVVIRGDDYEAVRIFRRLAEYAGICHIRTLDGSNYYADIQVSESIPGDDSPLNSYTFNITRVDSDGFDGIELREWEKLINGG